MENNVILNQLGEEVWKTCSNYPAYEVSNFGQVRNKKTKNIMKPNYSNCGKYAQVHLRIGVPGVNGKTAYVHRLVAEEFLDPPTKENLVIDHKDRNTQNNYYKNLHWVSQKQNRANSRNPEKRISSDADPIVLVDLETNEPIKYYESCIEAANDLGLSLYYIKRNIHNKLDYSFGRFVLAENF